MIIFYSGGEFAAGQFLPDAVMPKEELAIMMTYMYVRENKMGKGSSLFRRRMVHRERAERKRRKKK